MRHSSFIINRAISGHEFIPFYQPVVLANTRIIVGCEVVMFWLHPQYGLLHEDKFMDSVMRNNMLVPVMIDLINSVSVNSGNFPPVPSGNFLLSINCSLSLLLLPVFCEHLVRVAEKCRHDGITLVAELTDHDGVNTFPDMYCITRHLREQGVMFALGDYSGQYSDYDLLSVVHPHYIKLDKHYLSDIDTCPENRGKIDNVIQLSHQMDINLIIQGVDNQSQSGYLKNKDTGLWQGKLCGAPMPPELLLYHLKKQTDSANSH